MTITRALLCVCLLWPASFGAAWGQVITKLPPVPAEASKPRDHIGNWDIFVYQYGKGTVCYMSASPAKTEGLDERERSSRTPPLLTITHRTAEPDWNVTSINAGFPLKSDESAYIVINGLSYDMFPKGNNAWTKDALSDRVIQRIMPTVRSVQVRQIRAEDGRKVTDHYLMTGFAEAKKAIDEACNAPPSGP